MCEFLGFPSPVPTHNSSVLLWLMATEPIPSNGLSSKIGSQVIPPLTDFQTPPEAVPMYITSGLSVSASMEVTRPLIPAGPTERISITDWMVLSMDCALVFSVATQKRTAVNLTSGKVLNIILGYISYKAPRVNSMKWFYLLGSFCFFWLLFSKVDYLHESWSTIFLSNCCLMLTF